MVFIMLLVSAGSPGPFPITNNTLMKSTSLLRSLLAVAALAFTATSSQAVIYDVFAQANSSSGGSGLQTITLTAGQAFSVSADPTDLWSAGALPRWSNADGLITDTFATGSDESGENAGTWIGMDFGPWSQDGFTAPYGSLVGRIGSDYLLLGTNFSGVAPSSGQLELFYWDSNNGDNSGKIAANVQAAAGVPESGGFVVFGLAGAGLAIMRRFFGKKTA